MGRQREAHTWWWSGLRPLPAGARFRWVLLLLMMLSTYSLAHVAGVESTQESSLIDGSWESRRSRQQESQQHKARTEEKREAFTDPQDTIPANEQIYLTTLYKRRPSNIEENVTGSRAPHVRVPRASKDTETTEGRTGQVIYGTLRGQVVLECNLEPSEPEDSVSLVLWYKDKSMVPIYSIDARASATLQEARHKTGPWLEGRASLSIQQQQQRTGAAGTRKSSSTSRDSDSPTQEDSAPTSRRCKLCALLTVEALSSEDNGLYYCRVEFRHARSRVQQMQLRITVAAEKPVVRELTAPPPGRAPAHLSASPPASAPPTTDSSVFLVGPHDEGAHLVLECETQGGYPEPQLSWWRDGRLIDDSYEVLGAQSGSLIVRYPGTSLSADTVDEATFRERASFGVPLAGGSGEAPAIEASIPSEPTQPEAQDQESSGAVAGDSRAGYSNGLLNQPRLLRNRLELVALTRADLTANYSCQAWNTKLSKPPTTFVMIDMNLRPIKVQIENERVPVLADRPLEIVCRAWGSRPAAKLSWSRNGQEVDGSTGGAGAPQQLLTSGGETPSASTSLLSNRPPPPSPISGSNLHDYNKASAAPTPLELASNMSLSTLALVPQPEDNGQVIKCRAKNSLLMLEDARYPGRQEGAALEDSWQLEVHHLPRVALKLGDKLQSLSIHEGMDVYFECTVQARPWTQEMRWWFEGKELETNISAGVIISNQSLVLQRVSRHQRGRYTCSALNQVGEGHSNSVPLRVQYAPVCASTSSSNTTPEDPFSTTSQKFYKTTYGVAQLEQVQVSCHVDADPADGLTFSWTLEQHDKQVSLGSGDKLDSGAGQMPVGVISYTPRNELDYGTLLCKASNALGEQKEACRYQLVPTERPDPVRNCRLINASDVQLTVACEPGYDGGDPQSFQMEIYELARGHQALVANVTGNLIEASLAEAAGEDLDLFTNALKESSVGGLTTTPLSTITTQVASGEQPLQRHRHSQHHHYNHHNHPHHHQQQQQEQEQHQLQDLNAMAADGPQPPSQGGGSPSSPPPRPLVLIRSEPRLAPATNYFLSIYSVNGKGPSQPVAFSASTVAGSPNSNSLMEAAGGVSKSRSQSDKQTGHQYLLNGSDDPNNWSPLLVVGSIGLAVFVMFVSVSLALIKYVDFRATGFGPFGPTSAPASRSTTSSAASGGSSPRSQKARVIELSGGSPGSKAASACSVQGEGGNDKANQLKLKFHQKLRHFTRAPHVNKQLRHSNSDNYLNQLPEDELDEEAQSSGFLRGVATHRTLPRNCGQLPCYPIQTGVYLNSAAGSAALGMQQLGSPIRVGGMRLQQQQRNLQVTGCSSSNFYQPHLRHHHHQTASQLVCVSDPTSAMMNGPMEPLVQDSNPQARHYYDDAGNLLICPPSENGPHRFGATNRCCSGESQPNMDHQLNLGALSVASSSLQSHTNSPSTPLDNHQHEHRPLCQRQLQQIHEPCPDLVHGSSSTLTTGSSLPIAESQEQEPQADLQSPVPNHQLPNGAPDVRIIAANNALTRHYVGAQPQQKRAQQQLVPDLDQYTIYVDGANLIETGYGAPEVGQIYLLDKQRLPRKTRVRLLNGQETFTDQSRIDHVAFYNSSNHPDLQTDV